MSSAGRPQNPEITELLGRAQSGDEAARSALFEKVYGELRQLARSRLTGSGSYALPGTTALLHESYLRLLQAGALRAGDRRAFFAFATRVARSVAVDGARERLAQRRRDDAQHVAVATRPGEGNASAEERILRVHAALETLERADAHLARVVEMRYFGSLTEREIADTLGVAEPAVQRDWEKARTLLEAAMR
jgi:RNA polymerase sigma factor (TIGR02999 family)